MYYSAAFLVAVRAVTSSSVVGIIATRILLVVLVLVPVFNVSTGVSALVLVLVAVLVH